MTKLLFLLLLLGHISFAQTTIRGITTISSDGIYGDSINNSPNIKFNNRIKLSQINKSSAKVDIRLYRLHSLSNTKTVYRIFLVDTIWRGVEYNESNKPVKIKKYKLKTKSSFDSLFLRLLSYNIMTLPDQESLNDKMRKPTRETIDGYPTYKVVRVTDGDGYTVEIKIGNKYRVYQFDNPENYSKFYESIIEFKNYLKIAQTFKVDLFRK